ncbi:MAG: aminoglycoside phosphotransferase family protein [Candidatus Pacebacteria bacterium]|nr:aminoglycoside phosphotransferase family protein [Candidatus Paceibacterota bacterium]MCF7862779.1 aminoglycoside phosphotransferase family protein [Candidatus Paceibacterota bacterium]
MALEMDQIKKIVQKIDELNLINPVGKIESFAEGNANEIFLIDNQYVLKVAKKNPKGIEVNDINTESAILESLNGKMHHMPELIYRNSNFNCYLSNLIKGEILKPFLFKMDEEKKKELGKQLGSFLYEFHSQKINIDLQSCPNKNYHTKRQHQASIINSYKDKSENIGKLITEISQIIELSLSESNLVLTHSDFHWKNIIIDTTSYKFNGLIDFGNVCLDHPEVDFRQLMGRYDIDLGIAMVLEYEKLKGEKIDRKLLFAHCALNDLWHYYGKENKDPSPWYDKWFNKKNYFINF